MENTDMDINIGIIDDEYSYIEKLKELLHTLEPDSGYCFNIIHFTSFTAQILSCLLSTDILFLDIEIGTQNGLSVARLLRENGYQGCIIFLTAYKEYVFEGYKVNASDYILKPITLERLDEVMHSFYDTLKGNCYSFKSGSIITQIPYSEIIYFSSYKHYIEIHTTHSVYQHLANLKSLLPMLPHQFVQCHRTAIVNLLHIRKMTNVELTMTDNCKIPISRTYLSVVQQKIMEFI